MSLSIAIIEALDEPKNIKKFLGIPLFLYSVQYAINEGFTPVVISNSPEILAFCYARGVESLISTKNSLKDIVTILLKKNEALIVAVFNKLQPIYLPGWLLHASSKLYLLDTPIKDKNNTISIYNKGALLLNKLYEEKDYIILELELIDVDDISLLTDNEFSYLEQLIKYKYSDLVPKFKPIKICVISNRPDFSYDYSLFIDNCDVVVRVNKMCGLDSNKIGQKLDLLFLSLHCYNHFSDEKRHVHMLSRPRHIFYIESYLHTLMHSLKRFNVKSFSNLRVEQFYDANKDWKSTFGLAIESIIKFFPELLKIYCLCDLEVFVRTAARVHERAELVWFDLLISSGKVVNILKKEDINYYPNPRIDIKDIATLIKNKKILKKNE